jgi:hypothetical protein
LGVLIFVEHDVPAEDRGLHDTVESSAMIRRHGMPMVERLRIDDE